MEKAEPKYKVFIMDMFDYSYSRFDGEYQTAEEAIERAKHIVLRSFGERGKAGYEEWLSFGESASIISPHGVNPAEFSAQDFVKEICGVA